MTRLNDADRAAFINSHPEWELDGETLRRTFRFDGFPAAIAFAVRIAFAAEAADHHPDIDIRWNKVTLALSTHEAGALTEKDTSLASQIDSMA